MVSWTAGRSGCVNVDGTGLGCQWDPCLALGRVGMMGWDGLDGAARVELDSFSSWL